MEQSSAIQLNTFTFFIVVAFRIRSQSCKAAKRLFSINLASSETSVSVKVPQNCGNVKLPFPII